MGLGRSDPSGGGEVGWDLGAQIPVQDGGKWTLKCPCTQVLREDGGYVAAWREGGYVVAWREGGYVVAWREGGG